MADPPARRGPDELPVPSRELIDRVGGGGGEYLAIGRASRAAVDRHLPPGWSWKGKRVLEFGCGPGKVLSAFAAEAKVCEFHGCDIHPESVEWVRANLSPPFHVALNSEAPPLEYPDGYFDLVFAASVFTHLADSWAAWLREMSRVLKRDGRFMSSFLGEGMIGAVLGERWNPDAFGMNVVGRSLGWDAGGPTVIHSPWWVRAHWGRAFEIEAIEDGPSESHGWVVCRKRAPAPSEEELKAPEPREPRELTALTHNIEQLHREAARLSADNEGLRGEVARLTAGRDIVLNSRSWRLTRPLRALRERSRRN